VTEKQREVYDFVVKHVVERGYPPTLQEICVGVGYAARSSAHNAVWGLIAEGYLSGSPGRTLRLGPLRPEPSPSPD
jgi:repressor LexA